MPKQKIRTIPERLTWAFEIVDVKGNESILEIGCGTGILASLIAGRLSSGKITALDKSKPMIIKAAHRLEQYISTGRAEVITRDFASVRPGTKFDKVVAFNVNFFWKDSPEEFDLLKEILTKRSELFVFYDSPGKVKSTVIDGIKENLMIYNFQISEMLFMNTERSVFCIKAVLSQSV